MVKNTFRIWDYKYKPLLVAIIFVLGGFLFAQAANAERLPGTVEGIGNHFEITNSSYLNVSLNSIETVKLRLESIPEMITIVIEPTNSAVSTQITLQGFQPNATYYKYEDNYHNLVQFITDASGSYLYTQDLLATHVIFMQPRASTKFIKDDATGGNCTAIGTWDSFAKTCTLTQDVFETIQIDNDGITLDGGNYMISGSLTGSGIFLNGRSGVVIKNLNTMNFLRGISLFFSNNNTISSNTTNTNNSSGVFLLSSSGNTITGNTASSNSFGIFVVNSSNSNTITGNTADSNFYGIYLYNLSSNNIVSGNTTDSNLSTGIELEQSNGNILTANTTSRNYFGVNFSSSSSNNTFTNNTISGNYLSGIYIAGSNNKVYNNNFIGNRLPQATIGVGISNIFNLSAPIGGNYYSDFDTPAEGCNNANADNFCDVPYVFTGGQDNLPWVRPIVVEKTLSEKAADLAKELVNQPQGYLWGGKGWDYGRNEWIPSLDILAPAGYQYVRGLSGKGVDCSGLITWAFNKSFDPLLSADYNFVQYVNANGLYSEAQSDFVADANVLPGDAMFFDWGKLNETTQKWDGIKDGKIDHTAMYVGEIEESGGYDVVNASSEAIGIVPETKDTYKLITGFESFRRVHQADVEMEVVAGSPVDLSVTDPDGFTITPDSVIPSDEEYIREVPGVLYYLEMEKGLDGKPMDRVYSPTLKTGNYTIKVIPAADALPTDTYDLEFRGRGQTTILADNAPVSQTPSGGYGVAVGKTGTISTFVPVSIDIKPGSFPNSINLGSGGTVPVAIFGTATFNVSQIDPATITLANASVQFRGNGQPMASYQDMNGDSITDMVIHVVTEALELTETDVQAELNGFLLDGQNIKGSDSIRVVP